MIRRASLAILVFCSLLLCSAAPAWAQTGSISGKITDAGTTAGLGQTGVFAYGATDDNFYGQAFCSSPGINGTCSDGTYTITGLSTSRSYIIYVSGPAGYIVKYYSSSGGVTCGGCRPSTSGATPVSAGSTGIDVAISTGPQISGRVIDALGNGVPNINVNIYRQSGGWFLATSRQTDSNGNYTGWAGLPSLTYVVYTSNSSGYIDQLYSGITCPGSSCSFSSGTGVTISGSNQIVNFTLTLGGVIQGTLSDKSATSFTPLSNGFVQFYNSSGSFVGSTGIVQSGTGQGTYQSPGLPQGTYYAKAFSSTSTASFISQLYNNIPCMACTVTTGTTITVPPPTTSMGVVSGIDFAMNPGGSISGTITDGTNPIATSNGTPFAQAYDSTGNFVGSVSAASDGTYKIGGLATGSYFVKVFAPSGSLFIGKLYKSSGPVDCFNCDPTTGSGVAVTAGSNTPSINFALTTGGNISGTITNSATAALVNNANVQIYDALGSFVTGTNTNSSGVYTTSGLPAGSYFARAQTFSGTSLIPQLYNRINCTSCPVTSGTAIPVTLGATASGKDFVMDPAGSIQGTVTDGTNPIASVNINVSGADGSFAGGSQTNSVGFYTVSGLPAGNYFVRAFAPSNSQYISRLYDSFDCPNFGCDVTTGKAVAVTVGSVTGSINLQLTTGGRITGTIKDGAGNPLGNIGVTAFSASNPNSGLGTAFSVNSGTSMGTYSLSGLPGGSYFLKITSTPGQNFIKEVYAGAGNHVICLNCNLATSGTSVPVTVGGTASGIDFALSAGATISGTVKDAVTLTGLSTSLTVTDSTGFAVANTFASSGSWTASGLPPGTYFVRTSNSQGYIDQVYDSITCAPCSTTGGTAIVLSSASSSASNINFSLVKGGGISGKLLDVNGTPLGQSNTASYFVSVFSTTGGFVTSASTNSSGVYTTTGGLPTGNYFVLGGSNNFGSSSLGFINTLYDGITCLNCPVASGTPVAVTAGSTTPNINMVLKGGGRITGTITTPGATPTSPSVPLGNVGVQLFSAPDANGRSSSVGFTSTNSNGVYVLLGLPTGSYFVRTSNQIGYIDQLYAGSPCLSCDVTTGTPVAVTAGSVTPGVDFSLNPGGSITGTVTDTASTPNVLVGISVQAFNSFGSFVASANTGVNGTYTIKGLSGGSYYLRTFNNLGYVNMMHGGTTTGDMVCGNCQITTGTPVAVTVGGTPPTVNFALNLGGILKGRVTDTASNGLPGIQVSLFTTSGSGAGGTVTDFNGNFTAAGLVQGSYLVKTFNSAGFIDQVFNGIECVGCNVTGGTPIAVTPGTTSTLSADIKLAAGARIQGRVLDTSGNAIPNVNISVFRANGSFAVNGFTGADGRYTTGGVPPGDYFVKTQNWSASSNLGFVDKLYDNIVCLNCQVTGGKPVTLTAGATATGIDFTLPPGGAVAGTVKAVDGTLLPGVNVQIYTDTGSFVTGTSTNGNGSYIAKGLPTGNYVARTFNGLGYIDQLYDGATCLGCLVSGGKKIAVTVGSTTTDVNFTLTAGGRVAGTVTATDGTPISGVNVNIFTPAGVFVGSGFTSPSGAYVTGGLPTGNYVARTFNQVGYINVLHATPPASDIICNSCNVSSGGLIAVVLGSTTTLNFTLATGGSLSGIVKDSAGTNLSGVNISVFTPFGTFANGSSTKLDGTFRVGGLPTGSYVVKTFNSQGYIDQQYKDIVCVSCSTSAGTPVAVTVGADTSGVNFTLTSGGSISGAVTDATTSAPIAGINVQFYNASNFFVGSATTDNSGKYAMRSGMPAGAYYARTNNSLGFINVIYPSSTCQNCTPSTGTAIPVVVGQTTSNINFALAQGGRIAGTVTDAATGLPIGGIGISVFLSDGTSLGGTSTTPSGTYSTQGLPTGSYYVRTNNNLGYVNRLYDAIDCVRCSVATGKAVSVTTGATTSSVNFALTLGGRMSGTITDAATGAALPGVTVRLYDAAGFSLTGATADANGNFTTFGGLLPGTYYARTFNSIGYINKLYDTLDCLGQCNPIIGKPITVTAGAITSGVNFGLTAGGRIAGTITTGTSAPVSDAGIDVFSSGGTFLTQARSGSGGQYITPDGLPAGTYYLVTENTSGLIDQLYDGNACGFSCAVTTGKAVSVAGGATTGGINFNLAAGGRVAGTVTDKATGSPIANLEVDIFNSAGAIIAYGITDGLGNYTSFGGVSTGTYYAQTFVWNRMGYVNKVYNDITCPSCDPRSGTAIAVTVGATTSGINFALDQGEVISGKVTDAATGQPIPGATVRLHDSTGAFVTNGKTDDSGAYTMFSAVPAGTYFARTKNGLGYVDALYNTGVCLACDVTRGTPITVDGSGSTTGIDFSLTAGGRIGGTVTASTGGAAQAGVIMRFFNSSGSFLGQSYTNGVGQYLSPGLPPGNYYVRTDNFAGLIDELYNDAKCAPCTLSEGTVVTVVTSGIKSGVDFALDQGGLLSGYIKDQATGSPIQNVTVSVFRHSDGVLIATTDPTDANGYYAISLPVGSYDVQPNPVAGWRPPTLSSVLAPFAKTTIDVSTGTETTGIGFELVACTPLTVSPTSLPLATAGQTYSQTIGASGGTAPYSFSIASGSANSGLALSSAGVLSGTPTAGGTGNFTVAASDANQCGGTRTFALTACSFIISSNALSTTASAGNTSVTLTASSTDCTWTAASSASWITVTSAGSGTGNATVTFSWTVNTTGAGRSGTLNIGGQTFTLTQAAQATQPPFGKVDTPADGQTGVTGSIAVTGWALDDVKVERATICRDPIAGESAPTDTRCGAGTIYIGDGTFIDGARPDVAGAYPGTPQNTRAGWGYLMLTNMLPNQGNGAFGLHMYAIDAEGNRTELGSRTITLDNAHIVKPFGAIDTPDQGATISGTSYINFGWALTPQPKAINTDGSTITVYLDSVAVGSPTYNNARADIQALFPGFNNTDGAVGFRIIDTTTLANGLHSIYWVVTDNNGDQEGIGSRYFTVNNVLASLRAFSPSLASMRAAAQSSRAAADAGAAPVQYRTGFKPTAPLLDLTPDGAGTRLAVVDRLDRVELRFTQACGAVTGGQIANGEAVPLPVGSTLDPSGAFFWQPGPAFLGTYHLTFSVPACGGAAQQVGVDVVVK